MISMMILKTVWMTERYNKTAERKQSVDHDSDIEIFNGEGYGRVIDSQWIIQDISLVKKTAEIRKDNGKS